MANFSVDYSIDDENRLVYFNSHWNSFALENDSPRLVAENLMGGSLFEHISDEKLSQLWLSITDGIRTRRATAEFDYRCDSPQLKRYMKMRVSYRDDLVHFSSRVLRTVPVAELRVFDVNQPRSKHMILACSWCKRIKADETTWLEPEIATNQLQLMEHGQMPEISHGICPACYSRVWDDFEKQLRN